MDAQVRKSRLSPSFDINELRIIDHLRGSTSRAAFLRQRIVVLARRSPSDRDRLAVIQLPPLPDTGSSRVDIRLKAELLREFEQWLGGQLRAGDALRALIRIEGEADQRKCGPDRAREGGSDRAREPRGRSSPPGRPAGARAR